MMIANSCKQVSGSTYKKMKQKRLSSLLGCGKEEDGREALEASKKFMVRNRMTLLEKQIFLFQGKGSRSELIKIFFAKEICQAMNNFDHSLIVGQVVSTVYRGFIDGRTIAIKVPRSLPPCDGVIDFFLNQVIIQQMICHKNIVKLHGCRLETQVPILCQKLSFIIFMVRAR